MKQIITLLAFSILAFQSYGQNFKTKFDIYFQEGDTLKQLELLNKWEKVDPTSPELFTSYFNYYFLKSRQEVISMTTEKPDGESLSFQDSTGNTAAYIVSQIVYDSKILERRFDKINQGISLYPERLDMRLGIIYVYGQLKDWDKFTDEIVKTIQYSDKNKNQWTWTNNELKENGKEFFLLALQDYQLDLYNTGNDELLVNMRRIAEEVLKYYPNHIESLSNLSVTYLLIGEYDKGIEPLLRAEKLSPKDAIILANIAQGYKLKGDSEMAIKYYEKTIKHGDERSAIYAKQQIEKLKE